MAVAITLETASPDPMPTALLGFGHKMVLATRLTAVSIQIKELRVPTHRTSNLTPFNLPGLLALAPLLIVFSYSLGHSLFG